MTRFLGQSKGSRAVVVLHDTGQGGRHEGLAEADHVANEDAAALIEVVGGDLDGGYLIVEKLVAKIAGMPKLQQAGTGFFGEVIGDFEVDVVGWK